MDEVLPDILLLSGGFFATTTNNSSNINDNNNNKATFYTHTQIDDGHIFVWPVLWRLKHIDRLVVARPLWVWEMQSRPLAESCEWLT